MKRTRSRLSATAEPAALALLLGVAALAPRAAEAAARPRYGGTLRVEVGAALEAIDPSALPADPSGRAAAEKVVPLVFEGLFRVDGSGRAVPLLAVASQSDASQREWRFRLREGVRFHDAAPLTAPGVAESLEECARKQGAAWTAAAEGNVLVVRSPAPRPDLPYELAGAACAIARASPDGRRVGTGPFRVAQWEPGLRALLVAHAAYWDGRPYVDAIQIRFGRAPREQLIALELNQADVIELQPDQLRPAVLAGRRVWSSAPVQLVGLFAPGGRADAGDSRRREPLALALDRAAIRDVLLQRQGEIASSVFPGWLSGYAFLFPATRDPERARQQWRELAPVPTPLVLAYDPSDAIARAVSERVALDAREAGIFVQVVHRGNAPSPKEPDWELRRVNTVLVPLDALPGNTGAPATGNPFHALALPGAPKTYYEAEQRWLRASLVVPIVHLSESYALGARVRCWSATRWGDWRLAEIWLDGGAAPDRSEEKP